MEQCKRTLTVSLAKREMSDYRNIPAARTIQANSNLTMTYDRLKCQCWSRLGAVEKVPLPVSHR